MSQRSMEAKVGVLILAALVLLAGFIVIMGGLSFQPQGTVYVDFENPGALQSGAPVRLAGIKIGRISEIEFRGGEIDPKTGGASAPIRVVARLELKYMNAIHEDARWYVTTQGVLGEPFLAVEPGSADRPSIHDGEVVQGISPPRLDLLLSEGYELLHKAYTGRSANQKEIGETFAGLHATLKGTGEFFGKNRERLDNIVANAETFSDEANATLRQTRERYVTGPQVTRIMNNVERASEGLPPLVEDGRAAAAGARKLAQSLAADEKLERYDRVTRDLGDAAGRAKLAAADAQAVMAHVKRGQGTVGALVMDEAVYDDLQEMLRDLRRNPWKLFWKE